MQSRLNPYLSFKDNARQAMEFYKSVFGGKLTMSTFKDYGMSQDPAEANKRQLEAMAAVKLNVLHWHLSEDQGFRVESLRHPLLHQRGSDGLYYTQAEIREMYKTGSGTIRIRGTWVEGPASRSMKTIYITSVPYTVNRVCTVHSRGFRQRRRSSNRTGNPIPPAMIATQMGNMIQASSTNPMRLSL